MLTYQEFYDLKYNEYKEELESHMNPVSRRNDLDKFIEIVKKEYDLYSQQQGVISCPSYISNPKAKDFMQTFLKVSLRNVIPAEMCYYFCLSLACKKDRIADPITRKIITDPFYYIKFRDGSIREVEAKVHLFWSQDSSTGKTKGFKFTADICELFRDKIRKEYKNEKAFEIRDIFNNDTVEVFITRFGESHKKNGMKEFDYTQFVPGLFECNAILKSEEASFLFNLKNSDKNSLAESMLPALEGTIIPKTLVSWNGHQTYTIPNFIFFGCTRPTDQLDAHFFKSGIFQRMILYANNISSAQRAKMQAESLKKFVIPISKKESIATDLFYIYYWRIKNNIKNFTVADEAYYNKVLLSLWTDFSETIKTKAKRWSVREILQSLIGRYDSLANTLFVLNAMSHQTTVIENYMIDECINFLSQIIQTNIAFVEQHIKEDTQYDIDKHKLTKMFNNLIMMKVKGKKVIADDPFLTKSEVMQIITKELLVSENYAEFYLQNFIDDKYLLEKNEGEFMLNRSLLTIDGLYSLKQLKKGAA